MCDYFVYWPEVQEQMALKEISFLGSGGNLGNRLYKEHLCQMIINLDQPFRSRCCLKVFSLVKALVTAVILLPAHHESFAHTIASEMQSFYFSESQDAIVLQTCY